MNTEEEIERLKKQIEFLQIENKGLKEMLETYENKEEEDFKNSKLYEYMNSEIEKYKKFYLENRSSKDVEFTGSTKLPIKK